MILQLTFTQNTDNMNIHFSLNQAENLLPNYVQYSTVYVMATIKYFFGGEHFFTT